MPVPVPPPAATGCVTDVTPGVHEFPCDTTTDVVMIPEACISTACGVIIDVHGGSMSADMEDKNSNMRALGAQYGYIVIQPNALPNPVLLGERVFVAGDDDQRVMDILTNVIQAFHADQKRIHIMGFSEGGFMSWRWLCGHSDILASAAPAAAGWDCTVLKITPEIGCQFSGSDVPARNIPILYMQGHKDQLMNPECVFQWLSSNVYPFLKLDAGTGIAGDANFDRTRFLDPNGVPFELITHQYSTDAQFFGVAVGGHCYPGSTDLTITLPGQLMGFGCKDQCAFTWGEEAIKFFVAHPMP
jgi:polyhydroxybutyrate depolymerase